MIVDFQKGTMKVLVGMLAVLSTVVGQTCFEGPGGATVSDTKAGGHNIQVLGWRSFMCHSSYNFGSGDQGNHWEACPRLFWNLCPQWRI